MDIKTYFYIGIAGILLFIGYWVYNLYQENQLLKLEKGRIEQNEQALRDSVKMYADTLIVYTSYVRDLNELLSKEKVNYTALKLRFDAYIAPIHGGGPSTPVVGEDTITVPFSGEESIASYAGYTTYNTKTFEASWFIDIAFTYPVEVEAELFKENSVWRWRTRSLTKGVTVTGSGTLDSRTYAQLQQIQPVSTPKRYLAGIILGQHGGIGIGYALDEWVFLGYYSLANKYEDIYKNVNVGVFWRPF